MEKISSRKNRIISHLRSVASDPAYRLSCSEFICDGEKTLGEALGAGMELGCVLWKEKAGSIGVPDGVPQYLAPAELFDYASPLKSSPGPVFTVKMPVFSEPVEPQRIIVLENLQDPGNVGTVLRTANAFGIDAVILIGACADVYNPKTVRASMGAVFRQRVLNMSINELCAYKNRQSIPLYGAALCDTARDIRDMELCKAAVAVGSEGRGLSEELLSVCDEKLIIPMDPSAESLNAAVAAALIMWEMAR